MLRPCLLKRPFSSLLASSDMPRPSCQMILIRSPRVPRNTKKQSHYDDLHIEQEGPVFEIITVKFDASLAAILVIPAVMNLCPTKYSWLQFMLPSMFRYLVPKNCLRICYKRLRSNNRHFPAKDIYKLRKAFNPRLPQDATNTRQARTVASILGHLLGSEFQHPQVFAVVTVPYVATKNRPAGINFDR